MREKEVSKKQRKRGKKTINQQKELGSDGIKSRVLHTQHDQIQTVRKTLGFIHSFHVMSPDHFFLPLLGKALQIIS